ncbi:MAG: tetratricopeptide repeat protein [Candidatus Thalassarchaeaceae archaeon]|nr:tetratricopeptide repeat protein [Candidatus Thalassarchaeaceae archaeon]
MVEYTLAQANEIARQGDYTLAKFAYEFCIETETDNSAAWYGLGVVNHQMGDEEGAIVAFERAFLINRFHAPTAANLAILLDGRDLLLARRYANSALELGLTDVRLATIASRDEAVEEDRVEDGLDDSLESTNQEQETEELPVLTAEPVEVMEETEPVQRDILQDAANLIDAEDYEKALNLISPALEGDYSESAQLWYLCGLCLKALDLHEDALNTISYCLELDNTHQEALELFEELTPNSDSPSEIDDVEADSDFAAEEILEGTQTNHDEIHPAQYEVFNDGSQEEDTDDSSLLVALEDTHVVLIKQARESTQHGDHAGAVQIWKRIIEEYGSTAQAWSGMADALEAAGHVEKGFQCRTKANELLMQEEKEEVPDGGVDLVAAAIQAKLHSGHDTSPNQDDVNVSIEWYNKGLTLLGEDKGVEALNCFEKAISSAPREEREIRVRSHNGRGHALHQLGRFSESIQSYHQAISMDPTMVTGRTLYNMGSSYAAMEHFTDAIRCFEQALDRDLDEEEERLCKTQMNRCSLLLKEQRKTERIQS